MNFKKEEIKRVDFPDNKTPLSQTDGRVDFPNNSPTLSSQKRINFGNRKTLSEQKRINFGDRKTLLEQGGRVDFDLPQVDPDDNYYKNKEKSLKLDQEISEKDNNDENKEIKNEKIEKKVNSDEARESLNKVREEYSKELKKCLDEMDKQKSIDKVRSTTFNILAGVKNIFSKEKIDKTKVNTYKEEDFYTEQYKKLKEEYDQAKKTLQDTLVKEKREELIKTGLMDEKLEEAIKRFKATDVWNETVYDERLKMIDQRARANKNILTKTWNTYKEMPRYKKVLVGTLLVIPLSTAGGVGAVLGAKGLLGLSSFVGLKFGTGMGVGYFASMASAGVFDLIYKNKNIDFYKKISEENNRINDEYIKGNLFDDKYNEEKKLLEDKKKAYLKNQTIVKMATSIGLGLTAGLLAGGVMNSQADNIENIISHSSGNSIDTLDHVANLPEISGDNISSIETGGISTEVVAHNGQGVISALHELQNNLKAEYGDIDNAPENVKHILNSNSHDLAKEYGVYCPGEEAESAKIFAGDKLIFNKETGEVVFKHVRGGEHILQKGVKYLGEMFDASRK